MESHRWDRTPEVIPSSLEPSTNELSMLLGSAGMQLLGTPRDGDPTTALGNPFQCHTALPVRKYLLIPNLNLPCCNLSLIPLVITR